jgi:DNA primase catalytic subunit
MLRFPHGMRPSTLDERLEFYTSEFDVSGVQRWIGDRKGHLKFAMILGRHTGIFLPARESDRDNVIVIDRWRNAADIRSYALRYLPEALYYDRNRYIDVTECSRCAKGRRGCDRCYNYDGQQLAFDIDPENVDCPVHGHIGQKMHAGRGLSFCMLEFRAARRQAYELCREMRGEYDRVSVVYSGRGFHVVIDDSSAYELTRKQRTELSRRYARRYDIDEWVTVGGSRLMRLPRSLNGLVSRKCMVMKCGRDLLGFDPRTSDAVSPRFLRSSRSVR